MKIRTQILGAVLCLVMAGYLHAQAGVGGVGGDGGTGGMEGITAPMLQILPPFQLPATTVGASYSQTLTAAYGVGTLTWSEAGTLPSGLSLNSATGTISGTVGNNAGVYQFTVTVTDSSSPSPQIATQGFTLSVQCTQLVLTGPQTWPTATAGIAYNYTVPISGGIAPLTFAATNLPSSETINTATGVVSGTPAAAGISSNIGITVTDSCPTSTQSVSGTYTEQVLPSTLTIVTPPTLPPATTGVAYSAQLTAAGGTPPYTNWAITAGSLPAGIGLNPSTGLIAGTASVVGTSTFTVQVTDTASSTATLQMSLSVACTPLAVTTATLPGGTQNQSYSFQEQSSGGFGAITWTATLLPNGLNISSGGLISGVPTIVGTFNPSIVATDSCPIPQSASVTPTLVIAQQIGPALTITSTSPLPAEIVGQAVGFNMTATGGTKPYTWSQPSGSFPPGVTMNAAGAISGTPTTAGSYTPSIEVTDAEPVTAGPLPFSITVTCPAESITTTSLPPATKGTAYSTTLQGSGGITPIAWGVSGQPSGLNIASSTGVFSGTPTQSGTFSVAFTRTDSCLPTGTVAPATLQLQVNNPPLAITTTSLPNCTLNQACSDPLNASGGLPPYTWSITAGGPLQTGLSLTSSTGIIAGTPTATGTVTPTFQVTDSASNTATATLSLTVASATGADNRYCSTSETWTGPTTKPVPGGNANAPKICNRTAVSDTPSPGSTVTVTPGSCSSLQSAINSAVAGETIIIPHLNGSAQDVFTSCTISPAAAGNASNWITVRTDVPNSLPPEGSRISPAWVNITSLVDRPGYAQPSSPGIYLPKIIGGTNFAIQPQGTAAYWRFEGLELTTTQGVRFDQIINASGNHLVFDRLLIHGGNSSSGQSIDNIQGGILFNTCIHCSVIDSYIYDIHCVSGGPCQQATGVAALPSSAGDGPLKIVDNFIEASGENIFFGGSGLPSDVEVRRNHTWKPNFWATGSSDYFGTLFELDNCMESKALVRGWIEGNIFEHSWGQGSQFGTCVLFDPKNQGISFTGSANSDGAGNITGSTFDQRQVSPNCPKANHCYFLYNSLLYQVASLVSSTHLTLQLCGPNGGCANGNGWHTGGTLPAAGTALAYNACIPGGDPTATDTDVIFINNAIHGAARVGMFATSYSGCGDTAQGLQRIYFSNNGADGIDGWIYNNQKSGACCVWATVFQLTHGSPDPLTGLLVDHNTFVTYLTGGGNGFGPSLGFGISPQALSNITITNNISPAGFARGGPDGPDTVESAFTLWVPKAQLCWDHNFMITTTAPFGPNGNGNYNTKDNSPFPVAGDSGGCTFSPAGNSTAASFTAMQFTNNGSPNGYNINMQLQSSSPGHLAASDGTDVGVNWGQLQTAVAGVP